MAKGDNIEIHIRGGEHGVLAFSVEAAQNGRRVEYDWDKDGGLQWLVVKEVTRGGTVIEEQRFPVVEVVAMKVHRKEMA